MMLPPRHAAASTAVAVCLIGLAACQPPSASGGADAAARAQAAEARPAEQIGCPDRVTARLSTGLLVDFRGAASAGDDVCVLAWNGQSYRYYLGFWGDGRVESGTTEQREAFRSAMSAPVGFTSSFELPNRKQHGLWERAEVSHVGNGTVAVGAALHKALQLRVVRHGSPDERDVQAETIVWIDWKTGIPLKKESVIRMANGQVNSTITWEVTEVTASAS